MIVFFFFNDTATTEIYTLSLHDALPISYISRVVYRIIPSSATTFLELKARGVDGAKLTAMQFKRQTRSEEHTSELQSRLHLVCRLLLEKKKSKAPHLRWRLTLMHRPFII